MDDRSPVTLVLSCVDNYEARITVSQVMRCFGCSGSFDSVCRHATPWTRCGWKVVCRRMLCLAIFNFCCLGERRALRWPRVSFRMSALSCLTQCAPPLIVESGISEKTLKREGVCAASLPTTMGLVAAMLVQNVLKSAMCFLISVFADMCARFTLDFGEVSYYLGYNAMKVLSSPVYCT